MILLDYAKRRIVIISFFCLNTKKYLILGDPFFSSVLNNSHSGIALKRFTIYFQRKCCYTVLFRLAYYRNHSSYKTHFVCMCISPLLVSVLTQ